VEACAKFCWELGAEPRVLQWEVESLSWVSSWVQLYWGPEAMLGLIVNPVNSIVWGGPIFAGGTPETRITRHLMRGCGAAGLQGQLWLSCTRRKVGNWDLLSSWGVSWEIA
jgi:hypothetical protein